MSGVPLSEHGVVRLGACVPVAGVRASAHTVLASGSCSGGLVG